MERKENIYTTLWILLWNNRDTSRWVSGSRVKVKVIFLPCIVLLNWMLFDCLKKWWRKRLHVLPVVENTINHRIIHQFRSADECCSADVFILPDGVCVFLLKHGNILRKSSWARLKKRVLYIISNVCTTNFPSLGIRYDYVWWWARWIAWVCVKLECILMICTITI